MTKKLQYPTPRRIKATKKSLASKIISKSYKQLIKPYSLKGPR